MSSTSTSGSNSYGGSGAAAMSLSPVASAGAPYTTLSASIASGGGGGGGNHQLHASAGAIHPLHPHGGSEAVHLSSHSHSSAATASGANGGLTETAHLYSAPSPYGTASSPSLPASAIHPTSYSSSVLGCHTQVCTESDWISTIRIRRVMVIRLHVN